MAKDKTWAGGCHAFKLEIDHLRAIESKCDCGPEFLLVRIASQNWRVDDICNVMRFGLEGGGMDADKARALVRDHIEEKTWNLKATAVIAAEILLDALYIGDVDKDNDEPGEAVAAVV